MTLLSRMGGLFPNTDPANLPPNAATEALDVDLSSERIDLWRKPVLVSEHPGACAGVFCQCEFVPHEHKRSYLTTVGCDALASGPCVVCPTYICGPKAGKALGFPQPGEPSVTSDGNVDLDDPYTELRYYFITYGDECDEGAPSVRVGPIKADKKTCVTIDVPLYDPQCPCPYDITHVRVYRSHNVGLIGHGDATAPRGYLDPLTGQPVAGVNPEPDWTKPDNSDTGCFLVGTTTPGGTIEDCGDALTLGEAMVSEEACAPEKDLCIVGETLNGSLVGFSGDVLYFSERNEHHAWPYRNQICNEGRCIVDVCVLGNSVMVITDGEPYLVQDDSDCQGETPRSVLELTQKVPGCGRAYCSSRGAVFVSAQGLFLLDGGGTLTNLTEGLINKREWECYGLCDADIVEYCGALFITMPGFSGVLTWNGTLSKLSICPDCWIPDESGTRLYYLVCGRLYEWNAGSSYMEGVWTSALIALNWLPVSALMLEFSGIFFGETECAATVEIITDGKVEACAKVDNCEPIRFGQCRGKYMQVRISTRKPVRGVCFSATLGGLLVA